MLFVLGISIISIGFQLDYSPSEPEKKEVNVCGVVGIPNTNNTIKIWKDNCASCHKIDRKFIGPPMRGIIDRYESIKVLENFLFDFEKAYLLYPDYFDDLKKEYPGLKETPNHHEIFTAHLSDKEKVELITFLKKL